jgi:hypothetical protein
MEQVKTCCVSVWVQNDRVINFSHEADKFLISFLQSDMPSKTDSKKRPGPSSAREPPKKKAKVAPPSGKSKSSKDAKPTKKPARPVTLPAASSEEDSDLDLDEPGFGDDEDDWVDEDDNLDGDAEEQDDKEEADASGDVVMRDPKTAEEKGEHSSLITETFRRPYAT